MINKVVKTINEAIAGVESNMTFMVGGFGLSGIPENYIEALAKKNIFGNISQGDQGISQKQPKFYIANGGAYASTRSLILDKKMIVGPKTRFHIMPWERSVDIDEPIDLELARILLR